MGYNIVIYGKENCEACKNLKLLLKNKNYLLKTLDKDFTQTQFDELYPENTQLPLINWYGEILSSDDFLLLYSPI
jgi:glutaredoxin